MMDYAPLRAFLIHKLPFRLNLESRLQAGRISISARGLDQELGDLVFRRGDQTLRITRLDLRAEIGAVTLIKRITRGFVRRKFLHRVGHIQ